MGREIEARTLAANRAGTWPARSSPIWAPIFEARPWWLRKAAALTAPATYRPLSPKPSRLAPAARPAQPGPERWRRHGASDPA